MSKLKDLRAARGDLRRAVAELLDAGPGAVPLLTQLREEVAASSSGRGGGGGGRAHSPVPIAVDAHDLLAEIERDASRNLWRSEAIHMIGATLIESAPIAMPVETRIRRAASYLLHREAEVNRIAYVVELLRYWADRVATVISPESYSLSAPCTVCGQRWVWRDSAEESVRSPALVYVRDRGVTCLACGHEWPTADMDRQARDAEQRAADPPAVLALDGTDDHMA